MRIDNEGDFVEKLSQLYKGYTFDTFKFHYCYNYSFWENNGRPYCRTAPHIIKLIAINLTKLKQNSNEKSITELQRNCCGRVLIFLVKISAANNSLIKTDFPLNIAFSPLMALVAEAHLAEGYMRGLK